MEELYLMASNHLKKKKKLAALTSSFCGPLFFFFLNETNSTIVNLLTGCGWVVFVGQGQMNFGNPITKIHYFFSP